MQRRRFGQGYGFSRYEMGRIGLEGIEISGQHVGGFSHYSIVLHYLMLRRFLPNS